MSGRLVTLPGAPAAIVGVGAAWPAGAVDNATLLSRLAPELTGRRRDAMLEAIATQLGTRARHHLSPTDRAGLIDLTVAAAGLALERAAVDPRRIAYHLHATSTPSRWTTPDSARIGAALRTAHGVDAPFMDLRMGCTGGLQALYQGLLLASVAEAPVLVTAADRFSHIAPPSERFAPFVFGDGAAAAVVAPGTPAGSFGLVEAAFLGATQHVDLATVAAPLPPHAGDAEAWHLTGDPAAFDDAAREALARVAAHFGVGPSATGRGAAGGLRVIVSTTRPVTARALAGDAAWTETLELRGHLGAASALAGLDGLLGAAPIQGEIILIGAGGGLAAGGLRLRAHLREAVQR
jgi:3-oxoacyl-[acyl-carrier-protein] synthase III